MNANDFSKLDITAQFSLIISMSIRNEMEDFHCKHLSDKQMKELNPLIRQAIYNILRYHNLAFSGVNKEEQKLAQQIIEFHVLSIPDYWELPTESAFKKKLLEAHGAAPGITKDITEKSIMTRKLNSSAERSLD